LAFDGTNIYSTFDNASGKYLAINSPLDFSVIKVVPSKDYAGLTYDSKNKKLWGVAWADNKIYQIDPNTLTITTVNISTTPAPSEYSLTFNGKYLVFLSYLTDTAYKIIIDFPAPTTTTQKPIPGFDCYLALLICLIISLAYYSIQRRKNEISFNPKSI